MTDHVALDRGWRFRRLGAGPDAGAPDEPWQDVDLPHVAFSPGLDGRNHWTGICEYERALALPDLAPGTQVALHVGAAMHTATVLVDGREVVRHDGGYLPFEVDLTEVVRAGVPVTLTLRLDNRDNPEIPPGKPFGDLDFCWYGGLYREVELRLRPAVHLTDAVAADERAGGGIFARTLSFGPDGARVAVRAHVRNRRGTAAPVAVRAELLDGGATVACGETRLALAPGAAGHAELMLTVDKPRLWSPDSPVLHELRVSVLDAAGGLLDRRNERFGIRRLAFSRIGGFSINGRRLRLRGTNRHQEYPHAGYAAPRAAQFRDARRIKEAGFDYVRLSHYPQSPHFLDACDELGIVVMNAIPGWQFVGGPHFQDLCVRHARELIRRDRNHACVVLWELSLNETPMPEELMARLHAAGHEEYPGDQMFTCGWIDRYDVFIHSRQHGRIHTWANGDKALVIAEYGDWEFFATTEGFDQKTGAGVLDAWSNSRHFRGEGEAALRQQAWNHMLALNDSLASPAVLDGQWAMFDYARGYDPVRAAAGVMDVFRLPKFSYWFYRSQRDIGEGGNGWTGGPVVFVASHWTAASNLQVAVFSNCDEVELRLNGVSMGRRRPARTWMTQHLPHPPFFFQLSRFEPGLLEAVGYEDGRERARHAVRTPGEVAALELEIDDLATCPREGESDLITVHARLVDRERTLCVDADASVSLSIEGGACLAGPAEVSAEAGIASVVVRVPAGCRGFLVHAQAATGEAASCVWGEFEAAAISGLTR